MHRAAHRAVHKVRHHYHSPAVKIVAPAIVCVSTGAGLVPWLASAPPLADGPGLPSAAVSPSPTAAPVAGGMFVAFPPEASIELTIPPELSELSAELLNFNINETVPNLVGTSINSPAPIAEAVPEPPSILLLSAALFLFALIGGARAKER